MGKLVAKTNKIDSQVLEELFQKTASGDEASFHDLYELIKFVINIQL